MHLVEWPPLASRWEVELMATSYAQSCKRIQTMPHAQHNRLCCFSANSES